MKEKYKSNSDAWKVGYNAFKGSMRCPYHWDTREWVDYMRGLIQADEDHRRDLQGIKPQHSVD